MKTFAEVVAEQAEEAGRLRRMAEEICEEKLKREPGILGVLLSGSVARGDARIGPFGVQIDVALVVERRPDLDLELLIGPDEEPGIPYHCVSLAEKVGLAVEVVELEELKAVRSRKESEIFARSESVVLFDRTGALGAWKAGAFVVTEEERRLRSLAWLGRYGYLEGGDYRFEKWMNRGVYTQVCQNFNEAAECYCAFLLCLNGRFVPRKDWLAYLTYDLPVLPPAHASYMDALYSSRLEEEALRAKHEILKEIHRWMEARARAKGWLAAAAGDDA